MLTLHESFYQLLNERGFSPSRIVRVESAGDAGTPDVEILWVDAKKRPQRAYVCKHYKRTMLFVRPGWDV